MGMRMLHLGKTDVDMYLLPMDGDAARLALVRQLKDSEETWGAAYVFTDPLLISTVRQSDRNGIPNHWLLDISQAIACKDKSTLDGLQLTSGDITLTTVGPTSYKPDAIMHHKLVVTRSKSGDYVCWMGSVNFSEVGWLQANTAMSFYSDEWARNKFIPWFEQTREW